MVAIGSSIMNRKRCSVSLSQLRVCCPRTYDISIAPSRLLNARMKNVTCSNRVWSRWIGEAHNTTTTSVCNICSLQMDDDTEETLSAYICIRVKLYRPTFFCGWRGRRVIIVTQASHGQWRLAYNFIGLLKGSLVITWMDGDVLKLVLHNMPFLLMNNSGDRFCFDVLVPEEREHVKRLSDRTLLNIDAKEFYCTCLWLSILN